MKPASFSYVAPASEAEIAAALHQFSGQARLLAGGQSLVPMMNFRLAAPSVIIDINRVRSLSFIKIERDYMEVGALTRHSMLEDSVEVGAILPLIVEAMAHLGHRAVRNRGTIGGSLALAYPNAEWPLLLVTLDADVQLRSYAGKRRVKAVEFITAPLSTILADDEYIHSVRIPLCSGNAGTAFVEVSRRHGDFALAAAAAVVELDEGGCIRRVRAGVSGGQGFPIRARNAETALTGQRVEGKSLEEAARAAIDGIEVEGDPQSPAGYRRLLLTTMLERALQQAAERARRSHVH